MKTNTNKQKYDAVIVIWLDPSLNYCKVETKRYAPSPRRWFKRVLTVAGTGVTNHRTAVNLAGYYLLFGKSKNDT